MEMIERVFDRYFKRNESSGDRLMAYESRMASMETMKTPLFVVTAVCWLVSLLAYSFEYGIGAGVVSAWMPWNSYLNLSEGLDGFSRVLAHLSFWSWILLEAMSLYVLREWYVTIMEKCFKITWAFAKIVHALIGGIIILPLVGWLIVLIVEITCWGNVLYLPFAAVLISLLMTSTLWQPVWLMQKRMMKKKNI